MSTQLYVNTASGQLYAVVNGELWYRKLKKWAKSYYDEETISTMSHRYRKAAKVNNFKMR
ncbi:hypothetical protein BOW94_gp15 [Escherichia phage GA2A]|uniref:Uncharacterized protein n=1 Tax=Escherichia phage GA2A TaxID=1755695 RepID=A0A1B0TR46_9CAUD|nr:hypothetical protein BOW94_gp15 [Escherichia phage GA2A]ALP47780.1 hypothetical protein GA2A_13 [Escherichia phage GA2A]